MYASDLDRAYDTASIILENNVHKSLNVIQTNPLLRERSFGKYDLKTPDEFVAAAKEAGYEDDRQYKPHNGEDDLDVMKRVEMFINILIKFSKYSKPLEDSNGRKGNQFLIVTHGGWIHRLVKYLTQHKVTCPSSKFDDEFKSYGDLSRKINNASIFNLELCIDVCSGELISYSCTKCNSTDHLIQMNTVLT